VCAATPNNDDKQSCQAGNLPQTKTATGTATHPRHTCQRHPHSRLTCSRPRHFVTRQLSIGQPKPHFSSHYTRLSSLSSGARNPWAAFNAAIGRFQPMSHANPLPKTARDRKSSLESVRHPYGLDCQACFRVPSDPHCHATDTSSSRHIIPTRRTSTLSDTIHYIIHHLRLFRTSAMHFSPSHLFPFLGSRRGRRYVWGGTCVRGCRERRRRLCFVCLASFELDRFCLR